MELENEEMESGGPEPKKSTTGKSKPKPTKTVGKKVKVEAVPITDFRSTFATGGFFNITSKDMGIDSPLLSSKQVQVTDNFKVSIQALVVHRKNLGFYREMHAHALKHPTPQMGVPMGELIDSAVSHMSED